MKAVLVDVPKDLLAQRKITGADRWDEVWNGVLQMGPSPNRRQQEFEAVLHIWLERNWAPMSHGKVYHQINLAAVGGWTDNYRVPDLVLLTPDRFGIDHNEYFEGPPRAVVEIRSPGDETYEKLPFYAQLGVPEVWIFDRDTREPQLHQLEADAYRAQAADPTGWLTSALGVQMCSQSAGILLLRLTHRGDSQTVLAED